MERIGVVTLFILLAGALACSQPLPEAPPLEAEPAAGSVKGHFDEINIGAFDLVDGIAWPAEGRGTVIYVTSKPIASSILAISPCPATLARTLTAIRNAGWVEVTIDANGKSDYFASGTPFDGQMRAIDPEGNYVSSRLKIAEERAQGQAAHSDYSEFEFDLPLAKPQVKEVSESDRMQDRHADASAPSPSQRALVDAYRAAHAAARAKDWDALIATLGFPAHVGRIRALSGIDGELQRFADRFLTPGDPGETAVFNGRGFVRAEGVNSRGEKFVNYYWFAPCQEKLVLYMVGENPQ